MLFQLGAQIRLFRYLQYNTHRQLHSLSFARLLQATLHQMSQWSVIYAFSKLASNQYKATFGYSHRKITD